MKSKYGFTLVELIVAIGLFTVIMTLVSGAYFIIIDVNRRMQATTSGINDLSFALETMTRTIRTGTSYGCPTAGMNCSGGPSFVVVSPGGMPTRYELSNNSITQNAVALTSPSVHVESLRFYASGTAPRDSRQARVTIVVNGYVISGPNRREHFTVQTGATMRGPDI